MELEEALEAIVAFLQAGQSVSHIVSTGAGMVLAFVAMRAAICAQIRVNTMHSASRSSRGMFPSTKWLAAPVNAENVMTNTLVPTAVFTS